MSDLHEALSMVIEVLGKGAALIELNTQRIIAQAEMEALQGHITKLDTLIREVEARA